MIPENLRVTLIGEQLQNIQRQMGRLDYLMEAVLSEVTIRDRVWEETTLTITEIRNSQLAIQKCVSRILNAPNPTYTSICQDTQYIKHLEIIPSQVKKIAKLSKAIKHPMHFEIVKLVSGIQHLSMSLRSEL